MTEFTFSHEALKASECISCPVHFFYSPWKINMEPKKGCLEDDSSFQLGDFLVPC